MNSINQQQETAEKPCDQKPVEEILSAEDCARLREHYNPTTIADLAEAAFATNFPSQRVMVKLINRMYFETPPDENAAVPHEISAAERELIITTVLTVQGAAPAFIAIHVYWALMVGVDPNRLGWMFSLIGVYAGIGLYTANLKVLVKTLCKLKEVARDPQKDPTPDVVVAALFAVFP